MNLLDLAINKPINTQTAVNNDSRYVGGPIATTSLKKPDRPTNSYIIKDSFYKAPVNFVTDIGENIVNIKNAMVGKSNDHDLGRINDFAMKAGALGLAGYLYTRAKTPMSKGMELFGFASFFGAMALWPKLFIQEPLKAMYGLDIHQKYMDNEGRKKMFFQDPQYIPWDLYTNEELQKLGDKMGVPVDIHNRNEVIKRKAHKIALQGNTLWMLTAGFATPMGCALICNAAQKHLVSPAIEQVKMKQAKYGMDHIDKLTEKAMNKYSAKELDNLLKLLTDCVIDPEVFGKIASYLEHGIAADILQDKAIKKDLINILDSNKGKTSDEYVKRFFENIIPNDEWFNRLKMGKLKTQIEALGKENLPLEEFNERVIWMMAENGVDLADIETYINFKKTFDKLPLNDKILEVKTERSEKIKKLGRILYELSERQKIIDNYAKVYTGDVPDSFAANRWNAVAETFYKALPKDKVDAKLSEKIEKQSLDFLLENLEGKAKVDVDSANILKAVKGIMAGAEFKNAEDAKSSDFVIKKLLGLADTSDSFKKQVSALATELESFKLQKQDRVNRIITSFEILASDDNAYKNALKRIQKEILKFDTVILPDTPNGEIQGVKDELYRAYTQMYDSAAKELKKLGFVHVAERLVGDGQTAKGSLKSNAIDRTRRRINSLRNDFYKIINVLDFFKRADEATKGWDNSIFAQKYREISGSYNRDITQTSFESMQREIELCKELIVKSTIADQTTKFGLTNAQNEYYDRIMRMMHSTDFDKSTLEALDDTALGKTTFVSALKKKINDTLYQLGSTENPHASKIKIKNALSGGFVDILDKDSLHALRIDEMIRDTAAKMHNTSTWLKMIGGGFAALAGVTILAEMFFGRLKKSEVYIRKEGN